MRIRIVKQPPAVVEGISLRHYRIGQVYESTSALANYLVAEGYAQFELRDDLPPVRPQADRRKKR